MDTLLIVEDEWINYEYLAEVLHDRCNSILYAKNGQQAVDLCRNNDHIDLVLMDIKMPIMDGHSATRLIKAFRPELPVIAQSAYSFETEREIFLESGFDDYICKPIKLEVLLSIVSKYM